MISGCIILPAVVVPASRASATVGDAARRYARAVRLNILTCDPHPGFTLFRYHDHRKGGQALRLSSCYGVAPSYPNVPRFEETGDDLSSVTADYHRLPSTFSPAKRRPLGRFPFGGDVSTIWSAAGALAEHCPLPRVE